MIEQLNESIRDYQAAWRQFVSDRADREFFDTLQPVSVGWKVDTIDDFDLAVAALRQHADQVHMIRKNNRWLATMHLTDIVLDGGITIVNIMQRRPDSEDALALDNMSFYVPHFARTEEVLALEPGLKWTHESNGQHSNWISVWFAGREAKLRAETVLDVTLHELRDMRDEVMKGKK